MSSAETHLNKNAPGAVEGRRGHEPASVQKEESMTTVPNRASRLHPITVALVALTLRLQLTWHTARHDAALRAIARHQTGMRQTLENVAAARSALAGAGVR